MGGTTPKYGLPYPTGTDRVADGDNAMQALAEKIDDTLAPTGTAGTIVPTPGAGWGTGGCRVQRFGPFVVMLLDATNNAGWAANALIGTLPVGYRPPVSAVFVGIIAVTGAKDSFYVSNAGNIFAVDARPAGSGGVQACVTFMVTPGTQLLPAPGNPDEPDEIDNSLPTTDEETDT
jgi:hypothetical protein